jgi:AcrR family transcriptional regulator
LGRPYLTEDERVRRSAHLLKAARQLFQISRELPPVAAIADRAGVAKGSVYLVFPSKEEIFIALLEEDFQALLTAIIPELARLPSNPRRAAERFAAIYAHAIAEIPELLPLSALTNAVLEKNLPAPAMIAFKERLAMGLDVAALALSGSGLDLDRNSAIDLLVRTWSLTLGLWQALDFPRELRKHLNRPPLQVFNREFFSELKLAVRAFWTGSLG